MSKEEKNEDKKTRSDSPNPFLNYLSSSPSNKSPRSETNSSQSVSPRSPRFQTDLLQNAIKIPINGASISNSMLTAASPPRFATIDQFMMASNAVQNMALAHEISVNQNFKLEKLELDSNSLEKQIHDTVHKAFWDSLKQDFEKDPIEYKHAYTIIAEAKQSLLGLLLPNHVKFREQIEHILDMDLIKQQMDKQLFNYEEYALYIIDSMSKLCAPARDSKIEQLRSCLKDPVEIFRGIMETLELLKLDMANYTIQQMRPYIQQQVVAYEQKKFKELLDSQKEVGIDGLEATKNWLSRAYNRINENKTIGSFKYESGPTPSSITNEAFMEIFLWKMENTFPETLAMDEMRFNEIYVKCRKFLVVCAIVNTVFTLVGESIRGLEELRVKLKENILILLEDYMNMSFEDMMKNIGEQVIKLTNDALQKHAKSQLTDSNSNCIKSLIVDLSSKNLHENSVYKLLFSRYVEFLQNILTKRTQAPVKLPQGMSLMEKDLMEITGQFLRLVTFNKNVFGNYYGEIIQNF